MPIMKQTMFERLQSLPLLMGLGVNELMSIVEEVDFAFEKFYDGYTFVNQWDRCDKVIYVLNGDICAFRRDDENEMLLYEYFNKVPYLVEPQNLWGMCQEYERSYSFTSEGSICSIGKKQLNFLLSKYEIVKTNFLGLICNKLQYATNSLRSSFPDKTDEKIRRFFLCHKINMHGRTVVYIKMNQLADFIGDTRLNVSRTLNEWESKGLLELKRGCITIFNDEKFFK